GECEGMGQISMKISALPGSVLSENQQAGAQMMFLPPYSPDFNPIEMAFAKLKALLRAKAVRTVTTLWDAAGSVLDAFTPDECANFFTAAGYEPE
ncbi:MULTISPECIES: transposase, partial [Acetobacter]|uniref:transposase n=1 Tax=Acetobacter TaxID=434 RepID=UPI00376F916B